MTMFIAIYIYIYIYREREIDVVQNLRNSMLAPSATPGAFFDGLASARFVPAACGEAAT